MSKKILVVEDEPGILLSVKDEFESEGYTVYVAEDGEKGQLDNQQGFQQQGDRPVFPARN